MPSSLLQLVPIVYCFVTIYMTIYIVVLIFQITTSDGQGLNTYIILTKVNYIFAIYREEDEPANMQYIRRCTLYNNNNTNPTYMTLQSIKHCC